MMAWDESYANTSRLNCFPLLRFTLGMVLHAGTVM